MWRYANIIPLLKAGKSPGSLASFRPVSLTSCVVKTFERMLSVRLYQIAESGGMLSSLQAGFRKGRSCEDQIVRVVQAIEDGFQQKRMHRSVLVMLDYSKAYDRVWRQKLLLSMEEKGVPMKIVRWLSAFLNNRLAKVHFQGTASKARTMRQGLPQGSVLSPLLFLFFIDNLANELPDDTLNAMFADDVCALATARSREDAQDAAQRTVNIISTWSQDWKLGLNVAKCECSFFSTWSKEANWMPTIKLFDTDLQRLFDDGVEFTFRKTPRLLGVILDRQLSFGPQVDHVTCEATKKLKLLSMLGRADWGWKKADLMKLNTTFCLSKMMYAPSGWQPWCSDTQVKRLQVTQNKALRIVNGQFQDTPVEALLLEANTVSMATHMHRAAMKSAEKAMRMPADHPRRTTWERSMDSRNCRKSWHTECTKTLRTFPLEFSNRLSFEFFVHPPWNAVQVEAHPDLPGVAGRNDDEATKRSCAIRRLDDLGADVVIYTDGSADAGFRRGGSAAIVTRGSAEEPVVSETIMRKGAALTSSYEEELQAMEDALSWSVENGEVGQRIVVATDSQSLCSALRFGGEEVAGLRCKLQRCSAEVVIQWIPGHSDIPGNELVDLHAKQAARMEGDGRPISYKSACATINRLVIDPPTSHPRVAKVYEKFSAVKEKAISSRKDQVLLARIRSGHALEFEEYRAKIKNEGDPTCIRCDSSPGNLEHWLVCPGTLEARHRLFGRGDVDLSALTEHPQEAIRLARSTLRPGLKKSL